MKLKLKKCLVAVLAVVCLTMTAGLALGQKQSGALKRQSFETGEELVYVGEISRSLLRKIDVADFRFTATRESQPKSDAGQPYSLKFTGDVTSKGFFTKLFNLRFRQRVESMVEPASFTITKTTRLDEQGKRARNSETVYNRTKGEIVWVERDPNNPSREPRTVSSAVSGQIQDILSAIYYLRTQSLEVGRNLELTITDSGRVYQVPVKVVEKKRMKTVLGRVETVRVDPQLFGPNQMLAANGELSIWLTDDSRHIPVKARIKTEHGTFDVTLKKIIQNPLPNNLSQL